MVLVYLQSCDILPGEICVCTLHIILTRAIVLVASGDVLSGTSSSGEHHSGILEGWFGEHWWNGRFFVLLVTTLLIFSPLSCFKRVG